MITDATRRAIYERSKGRCETLYLITYELVKPQTGYMRCPNIAHEIHHRLTRARGAGVLDEFGETYHLLHLCSECHRASQGFAEDYEGGMVIQGWVVWNDAATWPLYTGEDEYLLNKYGEGHQPPQITQSDPERETSSVTSPRAILDGIWR